MPFTLSVAHVVQDIKADIHILYYLKIKHPYTDEIGSVLEGPFESVLWFNRAGGKDFISHYRHFGPADELNGPLREKAEHIVMKPVVIEIFFSVNLKWIAELPWVCRPVLIVMHGFHIVIRNDPDILTCYQ